MPTDTLNCTESAIAAVLELADRAARVWEEMWETALRDPSKDRTKETEILKRVLDDAGQSLRETLRKARDNAQMYERPLARLDELEARAVEFPLLARECLARWKMLDNPVPPLDPERVARAQAAYARGEYEDMDDVLA